MNIRLTVSTALALSLVYLPAFAKTCTEAAAVSQVVASLKKGAATNVKVGRKVTTDGLLVTYVYDVEQDLGGHTMTTTMAGYRIIDNGCKIVQGDAAPVSSVK